MEAVSRQALRLKKSSSKSDAEWSELSLAITELADAVEALDSDDHSQAIKDHLVPLATEFGQLLRNIRSKLVSDVCEQLGRIVKTTRFAFTPLATALLQALASTAKASSVAIRNPGSQLFTEVTEHSRYDIQVVQRVYRSSPQERVKSLVLEQMQTVLAVWPKDDIAPFYADMVEIMRRGMLDPSSHVRSACRQTFCSFADMWPESIDELVLIPSQPARDLLMKEKPHSAITKAIRRKFNIETPKTDSLRLRRSAIRRQGSSTAGQSEDSIFVDVKESPRRPSQRTVAAEPSARASSPGRAPTRSASPSGTNRTTSSTTRSTSPSGAVRSASTGRTTVRAASPSRPTRGTVAVAGSVWSASPARSPTFTPATAKHHTTASLRAQARDSEYDRYPPSVSLEEKDATVIHRTDDEAKEPKHLIPSRPQKRVSIMEPPSTAHFRDSDRYFEPPLDNRIRARREERESTAQDFSMVDFPHMAQSPPSDSSSPPKNRHAADALEFISQNRSNALDFGNSTQRFERHQPEGRHDKPHGADSYEEFSLPPRPDWLRSPVATPREVPEEEKQPVQDEAMIDSYLDRPISSSAPAPEPRASANVTLRGRRRLDDHDANEAAERVRGLPVRSISTHVAPVPVPGVVPNGGIRHFANDSDPSLSNSDEEPPSVSIDSAFRTTDMATAGVGYGVESSPVSDVDPSNETFNDDESFDKENVDDNSIHQQVESENPVTQKADALANLDAIRAGVQKLRETHLGKFPGVSRMAMPGYADKRDQKALPARQTDRDVKEECRPEGSVEQHSQRTTMKSHAQAVGDDDVRSARQSQQQTVTAPTAPQPATQLPLPNGHRQAYPPRRDQQPRQPPVQAELNPPVDFVRKAMAFTFGMAGPQTEQKPRTRAHAPKELNADNSRVPPYQSDDAQNALNAGPPPRPSAAPKHIANAPPPPKESRRPVPVHGTGIQPPHAGLLPTALRQQKPFSLNEGLAQRSDKQWRGPAASNMESAQKPTPSAVPTANPTTEALPSRRPTVLNPKPEKINVGVASKMLFSFCLLIGTIFGVSGLIQAVTKVRDAYEYHNALLNRINQFESSIVESYESVRKMDEKYVVWSEYVRELTEQDESNALHQLESIQVEVEKWQVEMKNDLIEFKRSLSGDIIDAALAHLREPNTTSEAATATESTP